MVCRKYIFILISGVGSSFGWISASNPSTYSYSSIEGLKEDLEWLPTGGFFVRVIFVVMFDERSNFHESKIKFSRTNFLSMVPRVGIR